MWSGAQAASAADTLERTLGDTTTAAAAFGLTQSILSFTLPIVAVVTVPAPSPPPAAPSNLAPSQPVKASGLSDDGLDTSQVYLLLLFGFSGFMIGAIIVHVVYRRRCRPARVRPGDEDMDTLDDPAMRRLTPRPKGEAYAVNTVPNDRSAVIQAHLEMQRIAEFWTRWVLHWSHAWGEASVTRQSNELACNTAVRRCFRTWRERMKDSPRAEPRLSSLAQGHAEMHTFPQEHKLLQRSLPLPPIDDQHDGDPSRASYPPEDESASVLPYDELKANATTTWSSAATTFTAQHELLLHLQQQRIRRLPPVSHSQTVRAAPVLGAERILRADAKLSTATRKQAADLPTCNLPVRYPSKQALYGPKRVAPSPPSDARSW